jgi:hypothetical protein
MSEHGTPLFQDVWLGPFAPAAMQIASVAATASATWVAANRAFYYPVRVVRPLIVQRAFIVCGATASGAFDLGIYDRTGVRITSTGSQAQVSTNAAQAVDLTDTLIGPGVFYVAVVMDNTTGTVFSRTENTPFMRFAGVYTENSAFPLPATATFATPASGRFVFTAIVCRPTD